jgi:hypothetical protein
VTRPSDVDVDTALAVLLWLHKERADAPLQAMITRVRWELYIELTETGQAARRAMNVERGRPRKQNASQP